MANTERFMSNPGNQDIIPVPVASATVIEKGDFVLIWRGNAIQPSDMGSIYSASTVARREGCQFFAGIAQAASASGETAKIGVDIGGDTKLKLTQASAAALSVADMVGIAATSIAGGLWGLEDQKVEADCSFPIAVVVEEKAATGTDVYCKLLPTRLFNFAHSYPTCMTESNASYAG